MVGQRWRIQPEIALTHQIAIVEQSGSQCRVEIIGRQYGAVIRPAIRLNGEVLSLRGPCCIQRFAIQGERARRQPAPVASLRECVAGKPQRPGALQQAVAIQRGRVDVQRISDDFARITEQACAECQVVVAGDKPTITDVRYIQRQVCSTVEGTVLLVVQLLCVNQQCAVALHQTAVGKLLRLCVQAGSNEHAAVDQFRRTEAERCRAAFAAVGEFFASVHCHGFLRCLRTRKYRLPRAEAEIIAALELCARRSGEPVALKLEIATRAGFPVQRCRGGIQRHRVAAVGHRIFAGGQVLRIDSQPFAAGQHAVLRHILRLQHQRIVAYQRACIGQLPAGGDVRFALRAGATALGKILSIDGQVAAAQQRTRVAEHGAAHTQGSALNEAAIIQRAGIQLSIVMRQ